MDSHLSLAIRQEAPNPKDNHDSEIIAIGAVFLALSTMGLIARMVSHAMRHINVRLDDYLLFWAYVRIDMLSLSHQADPQRRPSVWVKLQC